MKLLMSKIDYTHSVRLERTLKTRAAVEEQKNFYE